MLECSAVQTEQATYCALCISLPKRTHAMARGKRSKAGLPYRIPLSPVQRGRRPHAVQQDRVAALLSFPVRPAVLESCPWLKGSLLSPRLALLANDSTP